MLQDLVPSGSMWHILFTYVDASNLFNRMVYDYLHIFFDQLFYVFLFFGTILSLVYLGMSARVLTMNQRNKEYEFIPQKAPFVTIQIPTRNEIIALRCAQKCLGFDYPKDRYEILIGDDSNDKSVSAALDAFSARHTKVRIIRRKENIGFKPGNLNNMLKHTKGEIIVILDSDFIPEKDFLKRIVAPFIHDKDLSAVQARWKFTNADQNLVTVLASTIVYTFHHITLSLLKRYNSGSLCGSAEAVRKSDLIQLGGWKSGSMTEDIEYALRLHRNGKKILYLPALECYNEAPSRPKDLYKQQMRWAHGVISSYKIHMNGLLTTETLPMHQKLLTLLIGFGYLVPIVIFMLFVLGTLSLVTHPPEPVNWALFFSESVRNIALTSGLIIASGISLYRAGKTQLLSRMFVSSFSIGLLTTYYVNVGIIRAITNRPMEWYLLKKSSNISYAPQHYRKR